MPTASKDDNKAARRRRIVLVGRGRLGRALAARLHPSSWLSGHEAALGPTVLPPGDLLLIAVADDALGEVAGSLARRLKTGGRAPRGPVALHFSGALDSSALEALRNVGVATASCHPLQTFPSRPAPGNPFDSISFAIEGDPRARAEARRLARLLGGRPVAIAPEGKALYHAAAALAANGLVGLLGAALDALAAAGLDPAHSPSALRPIVRAAADAALRTTPELALTGPVARGDERTLERHRAALERWDPERLLLYEALVREQRRLVAKRSAEGRGRGRRRKKGAPPETSGV